jgi:8-oxo-dGTP pyrophosphatase MutT (NUDIX family)
MRTIFPPKARLVPQGAERVFKGIIFDVYHWQQEQFDGTKATFEMLKRPDTVKVLAIKDGRIVAVIDEQPGRSPHLTLPGGRHDIESETELDCAKRELLEETGLSFKTWRVIDAVQPLHKIEHVIYTFLATDFDQQVAPTPDAGGERIELKELSFAEAQHIGQDQPSHYWPTEIFKRVSSLQELVELPEYK